MTLKEKINAHQVTIGGWIMIGHPAMAEVMARTGLDWVAIDLEHAATDISQTENLIRAIQYAGSEALVRLTGHDPYQIKRVMDCGATGIIIPMIETASQAKAAVQALYYPPKGTRGVGLARAQKHSPQGLEEYRNNEHKRTVCIVQIEHINAVKNLEEILSVEGVDGYMLGPYDLSASMGLIGQLDHPEVLVQIQNVRAIAKKLGKPGGLHVVEPDQARLSKAIEDGFTFIAYGIDVRVIDNTYAAAVKTVRKL